MPADVQGGLAAVSVPIVVDGVLWGVLVGESNRAGPAAGGRRVAARGVHARSSPPRSPTSRRAPRCAGSPTSRPRCGASRRSWRASRPRRRSSRSSSRSSGASWASTSRGCCATATTVAVEHVISWPPGDAAPATRLPARRRQRDRAGQAHLAPGPDRRLHRPARVLRRGRPRPRHERGRGGSDHRRGTAVGRADRRVDEVRSRWRPASSRGSRSSPR